MSGKLKMGFFFYDVKQIVSNNHNNIFIRYGYKNKNQSISKLLPRNVFIFIEKYLR